MATHEQRIKKLEQSGGGGNRSAQGASRHLGEWVSAPAGQYCAPAGLESRERCSQYILSSPDSYSGSFYGSESEAIDNLAPGGAVFQITEHGIDHARGSGG